MTEQEINVLRRDIDQDNVEEIFRVIEGTTDDSLKKLAKDLDEFLSDKPFDTIEEKNTNDTNPFSALFSFIIPDKKSKKEDKKKDKDLKVVPDTFAEKVLRNQTILDARKNCFRIYDMYKKLHGIPSLPDYI